MERVDKFFCDCGVGTRSKVKAILKTGRVTVDGKAVKDGSVKLEPATSTVCLDGEAIRKEERVVLMLNKPAGFVTGIVRSWNCCRRNTATGDLTR